MGPLDENVLAPLITHVSPSRTARVRMSNASDPESGSVIPLTAMIEPSQSSGSQRRFCSSVPCFQIGTTHARRCAQIAKTSPPSSQP